MRRSATLEKPMSSTFLFALLENVEMLIALSALSQVIALLDRKRPWWEAIVRGVVFGIVGVLLMMFPYTLEAGITFDSRSVLLSLTGLFYGPITTVIATAMVLVVRLWRGGSGVWMGASVILSSAFIGYFWRTIPWFKKRPGTWIEFLTLGIAVHVVMVLLMFLLPAEMVARTQVTVGIPVLITFPIVTIIIGKLLSFQIDRHIAAHRLARAEKQIRSIYNNAPIGLFQTNLEGVFLSANTQCEAMLDQAPGALIGSSLSTYFVLPIQQALTSTFTRFRSESSDAFHVDGQLSLAKGRSGWVSIRLHPLTQDDDQQVIIGSLQDITQRKTSEQLFEHLATHDALTGAYNHRQLEERIAILEQEQRFPEIVVCVDVDNLKLINDAFGYHAGDELLRQTYKAIVSTLNTSNDVFRVSSSMFVVLVPYVSGQDPEWLLRKLHRAIENLRIDHLEPSASLGYAQIHTHLRIRDQINAAEKHMRREKLLTKDKTVNTMIDVIMKSLYAKNPRESDHSQRVSRIASNLGQRMDLDKHSLEKIRIAGLMHDIGKIGIPESILDKPGPLSEMERTEMQEHAVIGYRILNATSEFAEISDIILSHHEHWDGSGYPRGLSAVEIPLVARLIAVADAFDAMTSDRPYRKALTTIQALEELKARAGSQFDPDAVNVLLNHTEIVVLDA
jgi:diguanylate cyclase (GGDEF)-like protein/PAS domain S-box-containing protein/putative nucleotidyltransferase with HDIG domain